MTESGLAPVNEEIQWLRNFDQDDEFFHITCHVDDSMKQKISRGEFIDLERLLPKDKVAGRVTADDSIFKFGVKEGHPFVTPASEPTMKISNVKRWEQAFRVYAAIYTEANPSRASEVWQYVYVIHTAASSMPWENVSYYDYTFRQLMASKPWRSWAKTYTQGWNLAMKNNLGGGYSGFSGSSQNHSSNHFQMNRTDKGNHNTQDWCDNCCRRFNKNHCSKSHAECKYDHRCTYCGLFYHGKFNCRKRNGKESFGKKPNGSTASTSTSATTTPPE